MGRSGGSGGRSSGGSFGGSRSSGGRSSGSFGRSGGSLGGGRTGGSFGGGKSGGSFSGGGSFGSPFGGSRRTFSSGSSFKGPVILGGGPGGFYGGGRRKSSPGGCGCLTAVIIVVIIMIILMAFLLSINLMSSSSSSGGITKSTIEREALPKGSVNETEYFTDKLGWIGNKTKLTEGLKYFYKKTGVQPHLYITDNVNGNSYSTEDELDSFANKLYDELFTDEAHLLFVFYEYDGFYMDRYVCGTQAKTVIDSEAADILLDYVDKYYYDQNLSEEEFFSKAFSDAADRIMTVTKSPWIPVMIVFGIIVLVVILFIWWKSVKKQKNIEAKQAEDILNTPLERFGDTTAEDLAKKYEDNNE